MSDYNKLKEFVDEIDGLYMENGHTSPRFKAWRSKVLRFLEAKYGEASRYVKDIERLDFQSMSFDPSQNKIAYKQDLYTAKEILSTYLDEISETDSIDATPTQSISFSKIFIVHGHDGELKESIARIIERQDIEAIILSEQANRGRTIIEKIEDNSDVSSAICLFTADDIGKEKTETEEKLRARQNVVFETGYFIGKLGRGNIVILADNDVEIPSDLFGVVYTNTSNWKVELLKELAAIGYVIDFSKL